MKNIENMVAEYNSKRTTITAADAATMLASIDAACKKASDENHKTALDKLIEKPAQSAIILAMVEGTAVYDRIGLKTDSKTGELSTRTTTPELEWSTVSVNYAEKHAKPLSKDPTFETELKGFFGKLLENRAILQSEGGKAAAIVSKSRDGVKTNAVNADANAVKGAHSKTELMKNMTAVWSALLPDDIYVKPAKRDLNRMLDAIVCAKGREQNTAREKTLYKQFFACIATARANTAYTINSKF